MNIASLDTNVILRLLLKDMPEQHAQAVRLIGRPGRFAIADTTVIEAVFVLARNYQIPLEMQLGILRSSYDFTPKLEQRLMEHLAASGRLVERENGAWVKRTYKDGMIWYQKV